MADIPTPLVSIIIPAYNAQTTLGATLSGVLTQTYSNVECIVVDDGSTDRTADICAGYGGLIRYVRQENSGSSAARNHGFSLSQGEYIALCDADDVFMPTYLEAMMRTLCDAGGQRRFAMTNAALLTATGTSHGRELVGKRFPARQKHRMLILQRNFVPYMTLMPRAMVEELGGFETSLDYNEDWDFYIRAIHQGWEPIYQRKPLVHYRWTENSKSTHVDKVARAAHEIMRRSLKMPNLTPEEKEYLRLRSESDGPTQLNQMATVAIRAGNFEIAREKLINVAKLNSADLFMVARSLGIAKVPGAMHLYRARLRRIDKKMGRNQHEQR